MLQPKTKILLLIIYYLIFRRIYLSISAIFFLVVLSLLLHLSQSTIAWRLHCNILDGTQTVTVTNLFLSQLCSKLPAFCSIFIVSVLQQVILVGFKFRAIEMGTPSHSSHFCVQ